MPELMKLSIITVVYNREKTIERAIQSVVAQRYPNVEYLVIDGGSTDRTMEVVNQYRQHCAKVISERDKGIYDALNKGIAIATGDVIGILHSDDVFTSPDVLEKVMDEFQRDGSLDAVYGDVSFVNNGRVTRYYSSKGFTPAKLKFGFMPAHTAFFCRKGVFKKVGVYSLNYDIAGDFDFLVRAFKLHGVKSKYIPACVTMMDVNGKSTSGLKSTLRINKEFLKILRSHGIYSNYAMLLSRYITKVFEFKLR